MSVNLTTMLVMTNIFIFKMEGLPPTSDIKMIDIWLILCQMVPFAEVVLLTAMEYNRDDNQREHGTLVMPINVGDDEGKNDSKEKEIQRCWIPELKTLGETNPSQIFLFILITINLKMFFFREESVALIGSE